MDEAEEERAARDDCAGLWGALKVFGFRSKRSGKSLKVHSGK